MTPLLKFIDPSRKKIVSVELKDKDGADVPFSDTLEQIQKYISDQVKLAEQDKPSSIITQVVPLVGQALCIALPKLTGEQTASLLLSTSHTRSTLLDLMLISFLLLKFIQQKGLKILTSEESITEDDLIYYQQGNKATEMTAMASLLGMTGKEMIEKLLSEGTITNLRLRDELLEALKTNDKPDSKPTTKH